MDAPTAWLQEIIIENTPGWAHMIAQLAQYRGLRWMMIFPVPLVRYFTDVKVKTETNFKQAKGFRPGSLVEVQTLRVFKHGKLIGEKKFDGRIVNDSPFSKLTKKK